MTALSQLAGTEKCQAEPHTVLQPRTKRQYLAVQTVLSVLTILIVLMGTWPGGLANCRRLRQTTEEMERAPCLSPLQWNDKKGGQPVPLHVG